MTAKSTRHTTFSLTNAEIAGLLADEAENQTGILVRAFRRAARSAFLWPEEVAHLVAENRDLTELHSVGPRMARHIKEWIANPPPRRPRLPPERRDFLALADAGKILRADPKWPSQLRGDLQMHTHYSDGSGSIRDMAEAAQERGYEYIAITDHSKGLKIAGGIDERRLAKQQKEIAKVNARHQRLAKPPHNLTGLTGRVSRPNRSATVTVLSSIELNLNPRGEGDMDPKSLAKLDIVLGSFHSVLRVKTDQTQRYIAALKNPDIQVLGHPRGRIYNYRLGLTADWARVFATAARLDKALEIDCYPDRQDLNLSLLKIARKEGCRISLGTDAHHPWQLEFIELGLAAALLAKIPAERIINFMPLAELKSWVAKTRARTNKRR